MTAFDPAGRALLSCGRDSKACLWPMPAPHSIDTQRIFHWTETLTGKTLDTGGAVRLLDHTAWHQRRQALP